jgi:bifunctional DNase/RNase
VDGCSRDFAINVTAYDNRRCVGDEYFCVQHGMEFVARYDGNRPTGLDFLQLANAIQFDVELIAYRKGVENQPIYLREVNGDRVFLFETGTLEAVALIRILSARKTERPATHETMSRIIEALNAKLKYIVIDRVAKQGPENYYCASLVIEQSQQLVTVDVRPTDSLCLAVSSGSPIFVSHDVLAFANKSAREPEKGTF